MSLLPNLSPFFVKMIILLIFTKEMERYITSEIWMNKYFITQLSTELQNRFHGSEWMKRLSASVVLKCTALTRGLSTLLIPLWICPCDLRNRKRRSHGE